MVSLMSTEMLFWCTAGKCTVLGLLLFILYTHDMWFGLENMHISYADDGTLLARIPSLIMRSDVTESCKRDLIKISTWCNLWGMRLNPNKPKV